MTAHFPIRSLTAIFAGPVPWPRPPRWPSPPPLKPMGPNPRRRTTPPKNGWGQPDLQGTYNHRHHHAGHPANPKYGQRANVLTKERRLSPSNRPPAEPGEARPMSRPRRRRRSRT